MTRLIGEEQYLLDTNVVSESGKSKANPAVQQFLANIPSDRLFLSVMTIGEIYQGIALRRRQNLDMATRLQLWVRQTELAFRGQILNIDQGIVERWAEFSATGRSRPVINTLLAATADRHQMILVSRNIRDFEGLPVKLLNPWDERALS